MIWSTLVFIYCQKYTISIIFFLHLCGLLVSYLVLVGCVSMAQVSNQPNEVGFKAEGRVCADFV